MTTEVHVTELAVCPKALLRCAVVVAALATPSAAQTASARPATKADLVLINGTILTIDAKDSVAEALAIQAGKIVAVGSKQQILALTDSHTQILDLHGRTATPGIIDTTEAKPMAANGMCVRRETGVRISPTTAQATKAPVATPKPSTVMAVHLRAWASIPTATGQGSILIGVEKKIL